MQRNTIVLLIVALIVLVGAGAYITAVYTNPNMSVPATEVVSKTQSSTTHDTNDTVASKNSLGVLPSEGKGILRGVVMVASTCSGSASVNSLCTSRPYPTTMYVYPGASQVASPTIIATNNDGVFNLTLAAGTYLVEAQNSPSGNPSCPTTTVEIAAGATKNITMTCTQ